VILSISNWINSNQDRIAIVFTLSCIGIVFIAKGMKAKGKYLSAVCLAVYIWLVLWKTVFGRSKRAAGINLEFGWSYRAVLANVPGMFQQIYLNILLFVPLGCFAGAVFLTEKKRSCVIPLLIGAVLTILIEVLQLLLERGMFELDDIFNNMLGTVIGVVIVGIIDFVHRRRGEGLKR
jgi:glycopeptide antibiotics resistance protein